MTPLYMLAFDHRSSFSRDLLGVEGEPTAGEAARVSDLKRLVFEGFVEAIADGVDGSTAGLLVDEQYGAGVADSAHGLWVALAMPVERSGRAAFEFEFGDSFGTQIETFDPTFAKVLVRYNPEGDAELNRVQCSDRDRFDRQMRPELVLETIRVVQARGVEPDVWKIEGLDQRWDCERVARQARAGGRDHVTCIVLGRGADGARVAHWLEQAAPVDGFTGFAVGRTIWWNELVAYVGGELDRSNAAKQIGRNYRQLVDVYEGCRR